MSVKIIISLGIFTLIGTMLMLFTYSFAEAQNMTAWNVPQIALVLMIPMVLFLGLVSGMIYFIFKY